MPDYKDNDIQIELIRFECGKITKVYDMAILTVFLPVNIVQLFIIILKTTIYVATYLNWDGIICTPNPLQSYNKLFDFCTN